MNKRNLCHKALFHRDGSYGSKYLMEVELLEGFNNPAAGKCLEFTLKDSPCDYDLNPVLLGKFYWSHQRIGQNDEVPEMFSL